MPHRPFPAFGNLPAIFLWAMLAVVLTGCGGGAWWDAEPPKPVTCPDYAILRDASLITAKAEGDTPPAWRMKIDRLAAKCVQNDDDIEMVLAIRILAERRDNTVAVPSPAPYFIAAIGAEDVVLEKQTGAAELVFAEGRPLLAVAIENATIRLPQATKGLRLLIGLEQTESAHE
jgi:hypothetical protein